MITSKHSGFFTASILILFLTFAMVSGILTMAASMDFTDNAISWYDRQFIEAKVKVRVMEDFVNADPRFPDFLSFQAYLAQYGNLYLSLEKTTLRYTNNLLMPWGELAHRFDFAHTINGKIYSRPVIASPDEAGRIQLTLQGNAY